MASYLLDTSALVKIYHSEPGSLVMDRLFRDLSSRLIVTRLSIVEIESAFAAKIRSGVVEPHNAARARSAFEFDLHSRHLQVAPRLEPTLYEDARTLMFRFGVQEGLRTLDALQLAAALYLRRTIGLSSLVTADQRLGRAAELAGCPVLNPESPNILLPV